MLLVLTPHFIVLESMKTKRKKDKKLGVIGSELVKNWSQETVGREKIIYFGAYKMSLFFQLSSM